MAATDAERIAAVEATRETASDILAQALAPVAGKSEAEVRDEILRMLAANKAFCPSGWYDPPSGGVAALFGAPPDYERLKFQSLRDPDSFPGENRLFDESVGIVYVSPVDRATGMIGDTGLTLYRGKDAAIRDHIRASRDLLLVAAERAEVGMRFRDLYESSMQLFREKGNKMIGWMSTSHDPMQINLGHTVPGSYDDNTIPLASFDETREAIRMRRVYINAVEEFAIPPTCAFTVEARLTDLDARLPNCFFHVIVTFSEGGKKVLTNFDEVFKAIGMDYMLSRADI